LPGTLVVDGVATPSIPSGTITQLYSLSGPPSGNGTLSQLTGNRPQTNGYQYVGQTLLQWGYVPTNPLTPTTNTVSFLKTYPNVCLNVQATAAYGPMDNSSNRPKGFGQVSIFTPNISSGLLSNAGFTWSFYSEANPNFKGLFWSAIGY
jgi:hypothetical protein